MKKNIQKSRKQEEVKIKNSFIWLIFIFCANLCFALEPEQILIIANSDVNESVKIAEYYSQKRAVPANNILKIPLGNNLPELISRQNYDETLAPAIRKEIREKRKSYEIKCLLLVYGVPTKVGSSIPSREELELAGKLSIILKQKENYLKTAYDTLNQLGRKEMINSAKSAEKSIDNILKNLPEDIKQAQTRIKYIDQADLRVTQYNELLGLIKSFYGPIYALQQAKQMPQSTFTLTLSEKNELYKKDQILKTAQEEKWSVAKKSQSSFYQALESLGGLKNVIANIKSDVDRCNAKETSASVDSELTMVLFENYDLYRWQPNELKDSILLLPSETLMVSRIDGPGIEIAKGLIDKALYAEKNGLSGTAYVDARGMNISGQLSEYSYGFYDKNLNLLYAMLKKRISMPVVFENTSKLFGPGKCPNTALYCGWYSVRKYVDAFDFVTGAIGYHIASFEAQDLRNPASSNWCPAMLKDGITATLGPVDEPYLHSFPLPVDFFAEIIDGKCLVEAYFRTNPYNSWQLILIGDPLYKIKIKLK
ncbi:MAG: TIGR03790 family protein [Phycisphaerales bacterium]